ncbi:MAG TPA: hypothetical protein VFM29_04095, partial [Vicinamibacteria bacterium]|nr:hypothetical protein [Vicinamibacteria bacterium]
FPSVLPLLVAGKVNLTTLRLLSPWLTRENHEQLLAEVAGRTKRQVQLILARRFPQADVLDSVREIIRPLSPSRYEITFTADEATCELLELAQDLLRHAVPTGDLGQVFGRALKALVEDLVRAKFAVTDRPRTSRGQADDSRNIPAEVRRTVYVRDRGRCAFVAVDGHRCGDRGFVEFHHRVPYEAGGLPTIDNIELRCAAHNRFEADAYYRPLREHAEGAGTVGEALPIDTFSFRNEMCQTRRGPKRSRNAAQWRSVRSARSKASTV